MLFFVDWYTLGCTPSGEYLSGATPTAELKHMEFCAENAHDITIEWDDRHARKFELWGFLSTILT